MLKSHRLYSSTEAIMLIFALALSYTYWEIAKYIWLTILLLGFLHLLRDDWFGRRWDGFRGWISILYLTAHMTLMGMGYKKEDVDDVIHFLQTGSISYLRKLRLRKKGDLDEI